MLTLHFNDDALGTCDSLEFHANDNRATLAVAITLHAATPALLADAAAAIQALAGTEGDIALKADGHDARTLLRADHRVGPRLRSAIAAERNPGEARGQQVLKLTFEAVPQDSSAAVQSHHVLLESRTQAGEPARLTFRGKAVLRRDEQPAAHEAALLPALLPGWRRVDTRVTRDATEPALEYAVTHEQVFKPLPAGVEDGHFTVTDANGRRVTRGFFAGPGAYARALELAPPGALRQRVTTDDFRRRVDFEYEEASGDAEVSQAESFTFTTLRRVVDHPLLAAHRPAYRQQIGAPQTEVIQQGAAAGVDRHPSPPPARFAADLVERRVTYSVPHPAAPRDERFVTRWHYVSRSTGAVPDQTPNA